MKFFAEMARRTCGGDIYRIRASNLLCIFAVSLCSFCTGSYKTLFKICSLILVNIHDFCQSFALNPKLTHLKKQGSRR